MPDVTCLVCGREDTEPPELEREGVIQFTARHVGRALSTARLAGLASELAAWRQIFVQTGLIGSNPRRYEGLGFGNLSGRVMPPSQPRGRRGFLITGSQTGGLASLALEHFAHVRAYSLRENRVESEGSVMPSSESMTHGAFYDLSPVVRYVFHVHAPAIWVHAKGLGLPISDPSIGYGTSEMGWEVQRLYRTTSLADTRIMAMGGHTDGVIGFGRSAEEAGLSILGVLARAYRIES